VTYPQPTGADSVSKFQDFYRLNTQIASPGDIFELDVTASAVLIGPDSDFAQVRLTMWNATGPVTRSTKAIVTPDRSFNAPVQPQSTIYPSSGQKKGRTLFSPHDLFNPYYRPLGYDDVHDRIRFFQPRIDLMAYYAPQPSLVAQRSDKRWTMQYYKQPAAAGDDSWVMVPYYGRKYGSIFFKNLTGHDVTLEVRGVNFTMQKGIVTPGLSAIETALSASAVLAANAVRSVVIDASVNGMFDFLAIKYQPSHADQITTFGPIPTRIITSDDAL
jgi:hypothetical protein